MLTAARALLKWAEVRDSVFTYYFVLTQLYYTVDLSYGAATMRQLELRAWLPGNIGMLV